MTNGAAILLIAVVVIITVVVIVNATKRNSLGYQFVPQMRDAAVCGDINDIFKEAALQSGSLAACLDIAANVNTRCKQEYGENAPYCQCINDNYLTICNAAYPPAPQLKVCPPPPSAIITRPRPSPPPPPPSPRTCANICTRIYNECIGSGGNSDSCLAQREGCLLSCELGSKQ